MPMRPHRGKPVMTAAAIIACAILAACKPSAPAQTNDFAVLAAAAEGYATAQPGHALVFPRDHGAHPDYRIEWWYLTANLEDAEGREYGAQWTLFRTATAPPAKTGTEAPVPALAATPWGSPQVYMAHFALTWPQGHRAWQRYARGGDHGGLSRAGVTASPFAAWLDDWRLSSNGPDWLPLTLQARQDNHALRLELSSDRELVLQGDRGFSQKHPAGGGSWYYSQPFLVAQGEIELNGRHIPVRGQAWLDREWSSQFLQADQAGWDWFALHLDSAEKLMLFRLRGKPGTMQGDFRHGVLISPDGETTALDPAHIEFEVIRETRVAQRALPLNWRITLPSIQRSFEISALHPEQWMDVDFPYWEGVVRVSGSGEENSGRGYMELTGYPVSP